MNSSTREVQPDMEVVGPSADETGLGFWMNRVVEECERVRHEFMPEPVHDLRVSLRRCLSIAKGYIELDPHRAWKQMRKAGKLLFDRLGELRDVQVMAEWTGRLAQSPDEMSVALNEFLAGREAQLKEEAREAIQEFSLGRWGAWRKQLSKRAGRVPLEGTVFQHMALERLSFARALHRQACRNRTNISFHRLRIGLKLFRYTAENFLPQRHALWGQDLKYLQDLLGEMHDLDVLWRTGLGIGAFRDAQTRANWRSRIQAERNLRLEQYRKRMIGRTSLWHVWLAGLPGADQVREAAADRLQSWASFRDPDVAHSANVARMAQQLYAGLEREKIIEAPDFVETSLILKVASMLQNVCLARSQKEPQKGAHRMIRKLNLPIGWTPAMLREVALIVRYHRGALPGLDHKRFLRLSGPQKYRTLLNIGILRLAAAFGRYYDNRIGRLEVERRGDAIMVCAEGLGENDPLAEKLAGARYLLEVALKAPVLIRSLP